MRDWLVIAMLFSFPVLGSAQPQYLYHADIEHIEEDRVSIELIPPVIKKPVVIYSFPKIIPGSYSEKNFGDFINDFTARDKQGIKLKVVKLNNNQYEIHDAGNLGILSYKVNDTWDTPSQDFIFQPGGTNIEAGNNVVMNNHAFFGYFEGFKHLPVKINVSKPSFMYASTHLETWHKNSTHDIIKADNYYSLVDNPIFYSKPDTTSFMVGATHIHVSVISATGKVNSKKVAGYLQPLVHSLDQFFNGLPVSAYQFLFYFENPDRVVNKQDNGGFGALEHNHSSLYFLPELSYEPRLKSLVQEVAGHELLHILTPLQLHSEEIEDFDFINPKMSKHLWLYEGVTEYFAQLSRLQHGLISTGDFFNNMRNKINEAEKYGNFSLTMMSEHVLEDSFRDKYSSVYNKGALTAMMLDILIRDRTRGNKDLKSIITGLAKKYGPGKPFKDDELFNELVWSSHPDVRQFIVNHIAGEKPMPYDKYFSLIGYKYTPFKKIDAYHIGKLGVKFDDLNQEFVYVNVEKRNALEIMNGDVLVEVNDIPVTTDNAEQLWEKYFRTNTDFPELSVTVKRDGKNVVLTGHLFKGYAAVKNYLEPMDKADIAQLGLRNKLLKK